MIQELLYTSFQGAGLRKGTGGGFCTVLSTEGMASNLAIALEKLSGYKHPFDIHDPRSRDNPVNYRHAVMRIGGITYHVLSRIADHKFEHTGRSNKLAHHVAISKDALPPCGPAALCLQPGFFRSDWDGKIRLEPEPSPIFPPAGLHVQPCTQWEAAAGDAGWAGTVAEHGTESSARPISIVFPLGMQTLGLIAESMTLVPPDVRWNITFSTFFTSLPAGTSCSIRCVLAESQEAEKLLRDHRETVINLATSPGKATGGALVQAARTGGLTHPVPNAPRVRRSAPKISTKATSPIQDPTSEDELNQQYEITQNDLVLSAAPATEQPPRHTARTERSSREKARRSRTQNSNKSRSYAVPIIVAVAVMLLFTLVTAGGAVYLVATKLSTTDNTPIEVDSIAPQDKAATIESEDSREPTLDSEPTPISTADEVHESSQPTESQEMKQPTPDSGPGQLEKPHDQPVPEAEDDKQGRKDLTKPEPAPEPKQVVLPAVLNLPEYNKNDFSEALLLEIREGQEIAHINILGLKSITNGDMNLSQQRKNAEQRNIINIDDPNDTQSPGGFTPIAVFRSDSEGLHFQWIGNNEQPQAPLKDSRKQLLAAGLRWCVLEYELNGELHHCRLSDSRTANSLDSKRDLGTITRFTIPNPGRVKFNGGLKIENDAFYTDTITEERKVIKSRKIKRKLPANGSVTSEDVEVIKLEIELEENKGSLILKQSMKIRQFGNDLWKPAIPKTIEASLEDIDERHKKFLANIELLNKQLKELDARKDSLQPELIEQQKSECRSKIIENKNNITFLKLLRGAYVELGDHAAKNSGVIVTQAQIDVDYSNVENQPGFQNVPEKIRRFPLLIIGDDSATPDPKK